MQQVVLRKRFSRRFVARPILAGCAAILAATPLMAVDFSDLTLSYLANFANGSLGGSVDRLGIGTMLRGDSQVLGSDPRWEPGRGEYKLSITRPVTAPAGPVAAGLFATDVDFPAGSVVGLRATFIAPTGPLTAGNAWAAGLNAKGGSQNDLPTDPRINVALQVRDGTLRITSPFAKVPITPPAIPQYLQNAVLDPDDPEPFTLELLIDRKTGINRGSVKIGETVIETGPFESALLPADGGPSITAVGPSLAIARSNGITASVRVRSFEIFTPQN